MRGIVVGLVLALSTAGCAARGATPGVAGVTRRGRGERPSEWPCCDSTSSTCRWAAGSACRPVDGARWSATLLSADHERVVLQPRGRVTEPARAIPIAALQLIEPERKGGTTSW